MPPLAWTQMANMFSAPTVAFAAWLLVSTLTRYMPPARPLASVTHWLWAGLAEQSCLSPLLKFWTLLGLPNAPLKSPSVLPAGS